MSGVGPGDIDHGRLSHDGLVDVGGLSLHVRRRSGVGRTVLVCSALGSVCTDWDRVLAALPGVDVVVYDRSGTGHSPPPDPPWPASPPPTLLEEVRRLAGVGPAVGAGPPYVVVGHSAGGLIAQAFARLQPAETAGLVLVDASTAQAPPRPAAAALRHHVRTGLARTPVPRLSGPAARALLVRAQTVRGSDPLTAQERRRLYGTRDGVGGVLCELDGFDDAAADLAALERSAPLPPVPITVLTAASTGRPWRRRDRSWVRDQEQFAHTLGASVFRTIDDAAHLVPLDRPDVVAEEILRLVGGEQDGAAPGSDGPPAPRR